VEASRVRVIKISGFRKPHGSKRKNINVFGKAGNRNLGGYCIETTG
ncbi:unnamed protein product, partial [Acidithrix sp. C25]